MLPRLTHARQFASVLAQRPLALTPHFAWHGLSGTPLAAAVGVVVPKRWARRAVTRNLIRRQIYAITAAQPVPVGQHVVRLRAGFSRAEFFSSASSVLAAAVCAELQHLLATAVRRMPPPPCSDSSSAV